MLSLTYAGNDYWDRTLAIRDGSVRPEGINLRCQTIGVQELFRRLAQADEFDVAEMSMGTYIALVSRGDRRFVGIPVFPSRSFRHGYVFVNSNSGIRVPADLRGKRVGIPEYQMTAAIWIRGFLQHDFGVRPDEMSWRTGGLRTAGYVERFRIDLPKTLDLQVIPEDRHLEEMLERGDLDALVAADRPLSLGKGTVQRLFADYRRVECDYYSRTGIFPVMHCIVVRRALHEREPWVAARLLQAFQRAREIGKARLVQTGQLAVGLPWLADDLDEIEAVFGGRDPWAHGFAANRTTLQTLLDYSFEQGIASKQLEIGDLFVAAEGSST